MEQKKAEIMDEGAMRRAINRISYEVIERNHGARRSGARRHPHARRVSGGAHGG